MAAIQYIELSLSSDGTDTSSTSGSGRGWIIQLTLFDKSHAKAINETFGSQKHVRIAFTSIQIHNNTIDDLDTSPYDLSCFLPGNYRVITVILPGTSNLGQS